MDAKGVMGVNAWIVGATTLAVLLGVGWLGLQVQPRPFPAYSAAPHEAGARAALRTELPAPVDRYYRAVYGDSVPVVDSVVVSGHGRIRPAGPIWLPIRYRFTHDAGKGYRHYIEATWFGIPIMRVNERYVDGSSLMELPWASDSGPKVEQAANLGMWAELLSAAPCVLVTDSRVKWDPVDDTTAVLSVPLGDDATDRFVVHFDHMSGLPTRLVAMRYRDSASAEKIEWVAGNEWDAKSISRGFGAAGTATWLDMDGPWARFEPDEMLVNVDVATYLRARGL